MFFFPPLAPAAPRAKPVIAPSVVHSEPEELMCGGYSSEELQSSAPADQTAMLPYVDHDEPAVAPDLGTEMRAMMIATSLVGQGAIGDDDASRAFIQQLDAIDSPALRAAVKSKFQTISGQSLETYIRAKDDWNDNGEDRDQDAALQLISHRRDQTQEEIAALDPEERRAKQARADKIASELGAAALAHDDSTANVAKIHRLLGGCDAVETELVRAAIRRNFGGERNLYQLIDDGMDEADGDEQDVAIAMLAGDRLHSAKLALMHETDKGHEADPERLREIVDLLEPEELAELDAGWFKYGVLGQIENAADRAELTQRIAGDEAGANAERLANLLGPHSSEDIPMAMRGELDERNNARREEDNVLAEFEAMSGPEVKAAADAWRANNPGQPFEIMIATRWGDDPEIRARLLAMVAGDKGKNRSLRFQSAVLDEDQEDLEAALAHEQFDPADLASDDPEVRARAEAARDEQASFERHNENFDEWRAEFLSDDEGGARSTSEQLDAHYEREAREAEQLSAIASILPGGATLGRQILGYAHDDRIGGREMLEDGELSVETRFHRAEEVEQKAAILESLTSNAALDKANAGHFMKYGAQHGYVDMFSEIEPEDLEDMSAAELEIDHNRRFGVAEERPAQVQYNALNQLYALQYSGELETDEADREGGGTQLGTRQILDALRGQLEDPQLAPPPFTGDPAVDAALREATVSITDSHLDLLGRDADDGLREGASAEEAAAIAAGADSMLVAQLGAKKRLAERKAKIIATMAKIAAAFTANPALIMAINAGSNLMQMAVKSVTMGNDYDPGDDALNLVKDVALDAIPVLGKATGYKNTAELVGTTIETVANGGDLGDFTTAMAGNYLPDIAGDVAGGGMLGNVASNLTGFGLTVQNGGDVGDAALDMMLGFGAASVRSELGLDVDAPESDEPESVTAGASSTMPDSQVDHRRLENTAELQKRAEANLAAMTPDQRAIAEKAMSRARTPEHRTILERSLAAGDTGDQVDTMWMMSHNMSTKELARDLTGAGHLQRYDQSCVPTAYQVALADTSPRQAAWLLNNDAGAMDQQRGALKDLGGAQTQRQPKNDNDVYRAALADPDFAALQTEKARFSDEGDVTGIDPAKMVGTPLHTDLEGATGVKYEALKHTAAPIDRIERAAAEQRPVLFSWHGHEYAIVGRAANGELIIHDPMFGTTSTADADTLATIPFQTLTLPVQTP